MERISYNGEKGIFIPQNEAEKIFQILQQEQGGEQ